MESYSKPVVLDLTGVKLIDRDAVRFLAKLETSNETITNCPRYIREWILKNRPNRKAKAAVFSDRDINRPTRTIINA